MFIDYCSFFLNKSRNKDRRNKGATNL